MQQLVIQSREVLPIYSEYWIWQKLTEGTDSYVLIKDISRLLSPFQFPKNQQNTISCVVNPIGIMPFNECLMNSSIIKVTFSVD